jgi:hypothetical protein
MNRAWAHKRSTQTAQSNASNANRPGTREQQKSSQKQELKYRIRRIGRRRGNTRTGNEADAKNAEVHGGTWISIYINQ